MRHVKNEVIGHSAQRGSASPYCCQSLARFARAGGVRVWRLLSHIRLDESYEWVAGRVLLYVALGSCAICSFASSI